MTELVGQVTPRVRIVEAEHGRQANDFAVLKEGTDLGGQARAVLLVVKAASVHCAHGVDLTVTHDVVDAQGTRGDRLAVGAGLTR